MRVVAALAVRHLLGAPLPVWLRARLPAFAGVAAALLLAAFVALRSALSGHPFWGLLGAIGIAAAGLAASAALGARCARRAAGAGAPGALGGAYASAVTYVAVLGIAVATASVVVVIAVMDGLQEDIRTTLLRTAPHVEVLGVAGPIEDPGRIARAARELPGVVGAFPAVEATVLLVGPRGLPPVPVEVRGVPRDFFAGELEVAGDLSAVYADPRGAVFGEELARRLALSVGDEVRVVSPAAAASVFGVVPTTARLRIGAVFRSGFYEVDANRVYVPLPVARRLAGLSGEEATAVEVRLTDAAPAKAAAAAAALRARLPRDAPLAVRTWTEARRNLYLAMETERTAMFVVESLLVLVASFNITATLYMVVARKRREIAVLRVLGLSPRGVAALFALEGLVLGGAGGAAGLLLGAATTAYLDAFPLRIPGGGEVYYITDLPVAPTAGLYLAAALLVLGASLAASVLPARAAAAVRPAEELRHG